MKCLQYKESVQKIKCAKDSHSEALETTITATIKFLKSNDSFISNNASLCKEFIAKLSANDNAVPTLAKALEMFISDEVISPILQEAPAKHDRSA